MQTDALTIAEIALRAQVDQRTVRKVMRGEPVKGLAGARIARVLSNPLHTHGVDV